MQFPFVLLWFFLIAASAGAAPFRPQSDSELLEKLPRRATEATARDLARMRSEWEVAPGNASTAARLARRYFDLALERGDPRYVGYAEAVLARQSGSPSAELLLVRGLTRQYRHDFSGALADFEAALKTDADLAEAQSWRAAIYLVQADYAAARNVCAALVAMDRPMLMAGCQGLLLAYEGQLSSAYARLQHGLTVTALPENRLWLLTRLGEVAAWQGRRDVAEAHYRAALALGISDAYLMAAWADFLLDEGRADEVLKILDGQELSDPLLLRMAEAQAQRKLPALESSLQRLGERFAAARQRGDTTHRAEEARYQLRLRGDPAQALGLAAENYAVQREPRDARILLEAAVAARNAAPAAPALNWLKASGFEDARMRRLAAELGARP